jgi:FKBP-type peptidyl-prolyl cis-trans isomerase (trigger factor)
LKEIRAGLVWAQWGVVPLAAGLLATLAGCTSTKPINQGIDPRNPELDWEKARDSLKEQASYELRSSLLLEEIAEAEKIEVSDQEIEDEIQTIADGSRQTPEQVRAVLTKQGGERSIAPRLRNRKALDFLVANASVTDEEWKAETEGSEASSQKPE